MNMRRLTALLLCSMAGVPAEAQVVPFLSPDEAIRKMTYPAGFRVQAYAAEPDVVQPFAFTFDARGRMWIAENLNYETRGSDTFKDGPRGRIIILEDTDGDGRADKRTVFIDRLFFPTGLAIGFGGVWVGSPPNLLFIPDANGDDKPDSAPKVVLDGWGRHDRHETLNSFLWGPDGWLYGCQGVFTHSRVGKPGTPEDQRVPINAGVWRYHPVKDVFEVFAWGTSNPWGLDFDNHGQAFVTACVIPHLWHMVQGGRFHRQAGQHFNPHVYDDIKTIADHRHKSAHGGARFYLADAFPKPYRGRLFMCNIHDHAVLTDIIERRGSGFIGRHGDDFLLSNDPQWLGFNLEVGPDGSLFVIDWHDADICGRKIVHGETGRVYRISHGQGRSIKPFNLEKFSDLELVEMQRRANDWYVRQARRLLQERAATGSLGKVVAPRLLDMFARETQVPRKLRLLWCLHVINGIDVDGLRKLLSHDEEYVRAWAIQFLCEDRKVPAPIVADFVKLARNDPSPVVRLYLASACQRVSVAARWELVTALAGRAEDHDDHNLPLMIWYATEPLVAADKIRALSIAKTAKVANLARYISRRIVSSSTSTSNNSPRTVSPPKTVEPAKSVSDDGLLVWLKPDAVQVSGGGPKIEQWTNRARREWHAVQKQAERRPKWVDNLGGRPALTFDGKDDHFVIPHDKRLSFSATDEFTIAVWVYGSAEQSGWRGLVTKSRDVKPWYGLWLDPGSHWTFGAAGLNISGPVMRQSGWQHVCVAQNAKSRQVFVDGALTATGRTMDGDGKGDLWIGGASGVSENFNGAIAEVRIYNRSLSHPEVAHLARLAAK